MNQPKAFLCHASEDKQRFVLAFATRLRERGVDAWLDKWEIQPGDSLVRKIFDEGLQGAAAVIVILSSNSVDKRWVREEIDSSVVQRVEKQTRLIPVIIDKCEIPKPLQHLLHVRIEDLNSYDRELDSILNTIYGRTDKPPLGPAPQFYSRGISISGLEVADSVVLLLAYDMIVRTNSLLVGYDDLMSAANHINLSDQVLAESLQVLENRGLIKSIPTLSQPVVAVQPTSYGFETYLSATRKDYKSLCHSIAAEIVNNHIEAVSQIAERLREPPLVIEHIVERFDVNGWLKRVETMSGSFILSISPEIKRFLRD